MRVKNVEVLIKINLINASACTYIYSRINIYIYLLSYQHVHAFTVVIVCLDIYCRISLFIYLLQDQPAYIFTVVLVCLDIYCRIRIIFEF